MNILAIDTSTEYLIIGLKIDKGDISLSMRTGFKHATTLLPWINRLIEEAGIRLSNLQLIVCSTGPGSFTGLRIGLSTVKGLVMGLQCDIVTINSLDHFAYPFSFFDGVVIPVINARKNQYYLALYKHGERISQYMDINLHDLIEKIKKYPSILFTGPEGKRVYEKINNILTMSIKGLYTHSFYPSSDPIIRLGEKKYMARGGENIETLVPFYIRRSEAEIKKFGEKQHVEWHKE